MKDRKDINVIRAVAVLVVIINHLNPEWVKYGYLGVDIFFVVSGFLITRIYIKNSDKNWSVIEFITRRFKRLFPAMLMLLSVVYLYAFLKLPPVNLKIVGHYAVSALIFGSNVLDSSKGVDYFAIDRDANPIYHLWSLGVELQFYILISLLLIFIGRFRLLNIKTIFIALLVASLMLKFFVQEIDESTRFYMLPFRMWEFAMGCVVAFDIFKNSRYEILLKLMGLILITISLFFKLGYIAAIRDVVCVIGVVLFIGFGVNLFESKKYDLFNWIGALSYSIYLWHVPVQFVLLREMNFGVDYYVIYFISLSLIAIASYYFVEERFRYKYYSNFLKLFLIATSFTLIVFGVFGSLNGGYPERSVLFNHLKQNIGFSLRCNGNTDINKQCATSNNPSIAVVGNSYAMSFVNPLRDHGVDLVQLTQDSCAIGYVDIVKSAIRKSCNQFFGDVVRLINENSFKLIVISSPFDKEFSDEIYLNSFLNLISDLRFSPILIIGPTPRAPFNVGDCLSKYIPNNFGQCDFHLTADYINKIKKLRDLFGEYRNVEFFDISELICPNGYCRMTVGVDRPIYVDDGHLTLIGAKIVVNKVIGRFP